MQIYITSRRGYKKDVKLNSYKHTPISKKKERKDDQKEEKKKKENNSPMTLSNHFDLGTTVTPPEPSDKVKDTAIIKQQNIKNAFNLKLPILELSYIQLGSIGPMGIHK